MCFWTAAFVCLALRHQTGHSGYAMLGAFFAAISVGIKYPALLYVPVFVAVALAVERRWTAVAWSALIFLAFGSHWYVRNWLLSGNPVHPFGSEIFGLSFFWSELDVAGMLNYITVDESKWPNWYMLVALLSPLYWKSSSSLHRCMTAAAVASFAAWFLVLKDARYLTLAHPLISILAASVIVDLWGRSRLNELARACLNGVGRGRVALACIFLVACIYLSANEILGDNTQVHPSAESRERALAGEFVELALLRSASGPVERPLYQLGFENHRYHLGEDVRGDKYGRGRYADVIARAGDADKLAGHLRSLGARSLLVNKSSVSEVGWDADLSRRFETVAESEEAVLYRLIERHK